MEIIPADIFSEIISGLQAEDKQYSLSYLQRKINLSNFKDGSIAAIYLQDDGKVAFRIPFKPLPCDSPHLTCLWGGAPLDLIHLSRFKFMGLLVEDGIGLLFAEAKIEVIRPEAVIFRLPETCHRVQQKLSKKFEAKKIGAQMLQNGVCFVGMLQAFNAEEFQVKISFDRPHSFTKVQANSQATLMLTTGREPVFIGGCSIAGADFDRDRWILRLCPKSEEIHHIKPRTWRSDRVRTNPPLEAAFVHPLTGKEMTLLVSDLSSLGFSIITDKSNDIFPVGIVLPDLELRFAGTHLLACKAQVVYRQPLKSDSGNYRCGLTIIDIGLSSHTRLQAVVQQATDNHLYINAQVDMDDLWEFFFETGFIYPDKYAFLESHKEQVKHTYRRLYLESSFARHFTYKENGKILGHLSMLRFYENCWMIQHHAARTSISRRAGFSVLANLSCFIRDAQFLSCLHLDYVFCYYRPDNPFPRRVFGGIYDHLGDRHICSVDRFAYFYVHRGETAATLPLPPLWQLKAAEPVDYLDLESSYNRRSGGLMIRAFDLLAGKEDVVEVSKVYSESGFSRQRKVMALKRADELIAIVELNITDLGLNMSDLTNSIKVIAIKEELLTRDILRRILVTLAFRYYQSEAVPVLFFPDTTLCEVGFEAEKYYDLWIIDTSFPDPFFEYLSKYVQIGSRQPQNRTLQN